MGCAVSIFCLCILMGVLWFSHCLGTKRTWFTGPRWGPETPSLWGLRWELPAAEQQARPHGTPVVSASVPRGPTPPSAQDSCSRSDTSDRFKEPETLQNQVQELRVLSFGSTLNQAFQGCLGAGGHLLTDGGDAWRPPGQVRPGPRVPPSVPQPGLSVSRKQHCRREDQWGIFLQEALARDSFLEVPQWHPLPHSSRPSLSLPPPALIPTLGAGLDLCPLNPALTSTRTAPPMLAAVTSFPLTPRGQHRRD